MNFSLILQNSSKEAFCFSVIDMRKPMFKEMSFYFPNLKGITFLQEGFYGSITRKTFEGLENLERVTFKHTNVHSIEDGAFENLKNIKGNLRRILTLWNTATTHFEELISYSKIYYFFIFFIL